MTKRIEAIVMGGSAGAIEALAAILPALPRDCAVPVAIVVHMPETRPNHLVAALATWTVLPVVEAEDKAPIVAGRIYVAPPSYHLLVERDRKFALSADAALHFSRPAIDVLFESASEVYGDALAGVVLTGASDDGARGLAAIERRGGAAVIQHPRGAVARRMPEAAVAQTALADVLSLDRIAARLAAWARPARVGGEAWP